MTSPSTRSPLRELTIPRGSQPVPTHSRLHTRRVPVVLYVVVLLLVPGLVVAGFMSAGLWATTGKAATAQAAPKDQGGTGTVIPADPADVKGSMTVRQVLDAFPSITAAQILAEFGAPPDTPLSTQLKELVEGGSGTDLPAIRLWLEKQTAGG